MDFGSLVFLFFLCAFGGLVVAVLGAFIAVLVWSIRRITQVSQTIQRTAPGEIQSLSDPSPYLEAQTPHLIPWEEHALNQAQSLIVFDQGYRIVGRIRYQGRIMAQPATTPEGPAWMAFDLDIRLKKGFLLARTSQYRIAIEQIRQGWFSPTDFKIWVDDLPLGTFQHRDGRLFFVDPQGRALGHVAFSNIRVQVFVGPILRYYDFRPRYVPIQWGASVIGEINENPVLWREVREQRRPEKVAIPPLFQNLSPSQTTKETEMWMTALVLPLVYLRLERYLRDRRRELRNF